MDKSMSVAPSPLFLYFPSYFQYSRVHHNSNGKSGTEAYSKFRLSSPNEGENYCFSDNIWQVIQGDIHFFPKNNCLSWTSHRWLSYFRDDEVLDLIESSFSSSSEFLWSFNFISPIVFTIEIISITINFECIVLKSISPCS